MEFFDPGILGAAAASQQTFLLSPAPIHTNTRGDDQNMHRIGCYALKISMIEKTPTPYHRTNAPLPAKIETSLILDLFQCLVNSRGKGV